MINVFYMNLPEGLWIYKTLFVRNIERIVPLVK